ncbi:MAG: glycoside hydrolase family 3 protein [Candidatus Glassbacteria bacterium]|nr:glycoside hydrolase family 3 protein [Candidatus Glassbacteria bacterium]
MSAANRDSLDGLSLDRKLGLMVWSPFCGSHSREKSLYSFSSRELASQGLIGGILVKEGELYESATRISAIQQESPMPLVVAADIENGLGTLLPGGTQFPSNMAFGATRSREYGYLAGRVTAEEASAVGINLVLGPTCTRFGSGLPEGLPPVRVFGEKLHLVERFSTSFIKGVHAGGSVAAPRYYPGAAAVYQGRCTGSKWLHSLRKLLLDTELGIFETLSQDGLAALTADWREMPDLITGESSPVTANYNLLEVFLREEGGFKGVVLSPDLTDPALAWFLEDSMLVRAVNGGVDVLLGVPEPERVRKLLYQAVVREQIPLSRIDKAAERILALKDKMKNIGAGSIHPEEIDSKVASPANLEVVDRVAEDSITLLRDRKGLLPLDPGQNLTLLNLSFTARHDPALDKPLEEALRKAFDRVAARQIDSRASTAKLNKAWQEAQTAGVILCSMFPNQPPEYSALGFSPTQVEFVRRLIESCQRVMVASFGDPRMLTLFPEVDCYLCLYSDCPASQAALVRDIFGELIMPIKGKLPLSLGAGYPYGFGLDLSQ